MEVGYVGSAVYAGVLQDQIGRFRRSHPDVEVVVRSLPIAEVPGMLEAGSLDVGFVRLPMDLPTSLRRHALAEDDYCLALPADHPEAGPVGPVRPSRLRAEPFVVPEHTSGTDEVARRGRFSAQGVASPGNLAAVLPQVSLGHGVAVVPCVVAEAIRLPPSCSKPSLGTLQLG
ncbi:LysR family transcriptional regulator [Methylobacterium currus]|uniref:LysR family transcriptional regulator n=1 Tax=Methylobacterium currus TaxID=2051553 RepID=A0A2R4WMF1_9HYPH|nr:LysR family transcriptional regulator [Methylobacterium currus]